MKSHNQLSVSLMGSVILRYVSLVSLTLSKHRNNHGEVNYMR